MTHPNKEKTSGFTLIEMLTVIVIIAILVGVTGGGINKAKRLANKAKAETEMRELLNACVQYRSLYGELPDELQDANDAEITYQMLNKLTNAQRNTHGIVFYTVQGAATGSFNDPWGHPYRITDNRNNLDTGYKAALSATIDFPYVKRNRQ